MRLEFQKLVLVFLSCFIIRLYPRFFMSLISNLQDSQKDPNQHNNSFRGGTLNFQLEWHNETFIFHLPDLLIFLIFQVLLDCL